MSELAPIQPADDGAITELAASIVSAYVSNNPVSTTDLPNLIRSVHGAIKQLGTPAAEPTPELAPAVSIKKSITPDYLICLDDGKRFKSLRRHLGSLGMTPEQYRTKWGLPDSYPMVAPNYSATRSGLALANGLGRKTATEPEPVAEPAIDAPNPVEPVQPKPRSAARAKRTSKSIVGL